MIRPTQLRPYSFVLAQTMLVITAFCLPISVTAMNVFLPLAVLFSVLAGDWKHKIQLGFSHPVSVITLAFYALYIVSISYTTAPHNDILLDLHKYGKLLFIPIILPIFNQQTRKMSLQAFGLAMLITLGLIFMKFFGLIHLGKSTDASSIFRNHIQTSFLLGFFAYLLGHTALFRSNCLMTRCWLGSLFIATAIAIFFMNHSRTGYLVFAGIFLLLACQHYSWRGFVGALLAACIAAGLAFSFSHQIKATVFTALNGQSHTAQFDNSIHLRKQFMLNSLKLIKEKPIFGSGIGSFLTEYSRFGPIPTIGDYLRTPHNEMLMTTVQLGLVGLLMFLAIFGVQWWAAHRLNKIDRYLAQGVIIAFFCGCMSDALLYASTTGYFFVYFSALCFSNVPSDPS